ncbi:MAG: hypothetical protein ABW023_12645 [Sphingomonas sp.]
MSAENTVRLVVEDGDEYEVAAIKAFLVKQISFEDLQASLDLGRAQTYRRLGAFKELGAEGLRNRKLGVTNNAYSEQDKANVIAIVRANYPDFGPTLACEKLLEVHGIRVSLGTLKKWMKDRRCGSGTHRTWPSERLTCV